MFSVYVLIHLSQAALNARLWYNEKFLTLEQLEHPSIKCSEALSPFQGYVTLSSCFSSI